MPDEASIPGYEQLREELRKDIRDEVRNALRELGKSSAGGGAADPLGLGPFGPLGGKCFIIIAVPVGCPEHGAVTRFARLGEEGPEQ